MPYLLTLLAGMMISLMVALNGALSQSLGLPAAMVIIHLMGLLTILVAMLLGQEKPRLRGLPGTMMLAGLLGIITTLSNNYAFSRIGVSTIMALALMGDSLGSLVADHYGLLGLKKRAFQKQKLWGLLLALGGIAAMISGLAALPVLLSLLAGLTVLISRLMNGILARQSSIRNSAFINYLVGLLGSLALFLFWRQGPGLRALPDTPPYLLSGAAIGALVVLLSNHVVGLIPSFYMSLTVFVGQVTAGILLDMLLTQSFPWRNLVGGLLVLAGLGLNLWQDRRQTAPRKGKRTAGTMR